MKVSKVVFWIFLVLGIFLLVGGYNLYQYADEHASYDLKVKMIGNKLVPDYVSSTAKESTTGIIMMLLGIPVVLLGGFLSGVLEDAINGKKTKTKKDPLLSSPEQNSPKKETLKKGKEERSVFTCPNCRTTVFSLEGKTEADCPYCGKVFKR